MNTAKLMRSPEDLEGRFAGKRVRLLTLVLIRWIAITGQAAAIIFVHAILRYDFPFEAAILTVGVSGILNGVVTLKYRRTTRLSDREASVHLAYDILQLSVLIYLTGGLVNPFSLLFLVPVTISATVLSLRSTVILSLLSILCVSVLLYFHMPLPWKEAGIVLPHLYQSAVWGGLVVGMIFITGYVSMVSAEVRQMEDALSATQLALLREQRMSAIGGIAAAVAHEMGTPLGTITLVAKELEHEFDCDDPLYEDVQILRAEAMRCRDILGRLSNPAEEDAQDKFFTEQTLPVIVEEALGHYPTNGKKVEILIDPNVRGEKPRMLRQPEIIHGLGNFIENAIDFSNLAVELRCYWDENEVRLEIRDDGPGIGMDILQTLGEPYISSRRGKGGMGLGVFIATTLLERTGASVDYGNIHDGGAIITVGWPRDVIELQKEQRLNV